MNDMERVPLAFGEWITSTGLVTYIKYEAPNNVGEMNVR